jgi:hypothetical protein
VHPRRDHDRARLGQRLRPGRDVWHVAEYFARCIQHHRPGIDCNASWEKQADGTWQATVVLVGRDGITPPM